MNLLAMAMLLEARPLPFLHADFAAALLGMAVLAGSAWVALRMAKRQPNSDEEVWRQLGGAAVIALNAMAVLSGVREIAALWRHGITGPSDRLQEALAISAFLMLYSSMLLAVGFWRRTAFVRWQGLALLVFTIGKTFLYDIASLSQGYRVASLLGLGVLLMGVSFAYQKDWLGLRESAAVSIPLEEEPH